MAGLRLNSAGALRLGALLALALFLLGLAAAQAQESLPPKPERYVNDYAGVMPDDAENQLNAQLEQFEKETSNQIVVAVFRKIPGDFALEDFTQRTAEAWRVGQAKNDNGAVLFVFIDDRKMRIEVGYGLEGALPDALARRIIDEEIRPAFQAGDFARGLTAGATAMMQAARGEYTGTGRTAGRRGPEQSLATGWICLLFTLLMVFNIFRGRQARRRGRRHLRGGGWMMFPPMGGGGWGGGGWSGGGGFGGGGGFSGGGGSFGGGGASGNW